MQCGCNSHLPQVGTRSRTPPQNPRSPPRSSSSRRGSDRSDPSGAQGQDTTFPIWPGEEKGRRQVPQALIFAEFSERGHCSKNEEGPQDNRSVSLAMQRITTRPLSLPFLAKPTIAPSKVHQSFLETQIIIDSETSPHHG